MLGIRIRVSAVKKTDIVSAIVGNSSGVNRGRERRPKTSHERNWVGYWTGAKTVTQEWYFFFKTKGRPPKNVSVSSSGHSVDGAVLMPVAGMGGAGGPFKLAVKRKQRKFIGKTLGRPKKFYLFTDMESHLNLPPATGPNAQITNAAVNKDAQINHPPYSEMITAAIVAMKERDGSSKQAIAKYIESEYKNLSPSHATLLTQQIKKMKNQGQLIMNKHSFMLSGFGNRQSFVKGSVVTKRRPGRPPKIPSNGGGVGAVASPAVSCISGLPVIAAPSVMIGGVQMVVPMGEVDGGTPFKRCPGRPPKLHAVVVEAEPGAGAEAGSGLEAVSVGWRLPKDNNGIVGAGNGEGGSVLGKRGRGCVVEEAVMVSALLGNNNGVKRGCGRPHKNVVVNSSGHSDGGAVLVPVEGMEGAVRSSKIEVRRPNKQSRVKHAVDIVKPYLDNEFAPIALGGLQEVEEIALMRAPVSRGALSGEGATVTGIIGAPSSDQGGPGCDPVEALCAECWNLRI